ncbi:MAG: hypothetical protein AABX12_05120 [Nanoarchaeota archaeon]
MNHYYPENGEDGTSPPPQLFTRSGSPIVQMGTGKYLAGRIRHMRDAPLGLDENPDICREAYEVLGALLERRLATQGKPTVAELARLAIKAGYLVIDEAMAHNAGNVLESPFQPIGSLAELTRALEIRLGGDAQDYTGIIEIVRGLYAGVSMKTTKLQRQLQIALGVEEKDTPAELPVQRRKHVLGLLSRLGEEIVSSGKEPAASAPASEQLTELYRMFDRTLNDLSAAHEERDGLYGKITDLRAEVERLEEENAELRHVADVNVLAGLLLDGRVGIEPTYGQSGANQNLIGIERGDGTSGADSVEPI